MIRYMIETEPTMSVSKIVNPLHITFGEDTQTISENISGKSVPFGRMDILHVVWVMFQKELYRESRLGIPRGGDSTC